MSTSIRKGYTKKLDSREWYIHDGFLYWKEDGQNKILLSDLPNVRFDSGDSGMNIPSNIANIVIDHARHPEKLSNDARQSYVMSSDEFTNKLFLKVAKIVLGSKKWTDAEKILFLIRKLPLLDGFDYGKEVNKLLYQANWETNKFIKRMNRFYDYMEDFCETASDLNSCIIKDRKMVNNMTNSVTLFRGFNIPSDETIRSKNINNWMKQESGKSVYFTLDKDIARWFACTQKLKLIQMVQSNKTLNDVQNKLLDAKLVVAEYTVNIDDIILFVDTLRRSEMECVALPSNALLKNYSFMGFDDFIVACELFISH